MIEIIPAIDIIEGKCVRLTRGDYDTKRVYNEDPLEVAQAMESAGCRRLHLVDLDGAKAAHIVNYRTGAAGFAHIADNRLRRRSEV